MSTTTTSAAPVGCTTITHRLGLYLEHVTRQGQPFSWSSNNCCHFAAGWLLREEGLHALAGMPPVVDARSAVRAMRDMGGRFSAAISRQLQRQAIVPAYARAGDLVLLEVAGYLGGRDVGLGQALGICAGRTAVFLDPAGVCVHLPTAMGVAAWRVGVQA